MENIKIKGLEDGDLSKYSIGYLARIEGGKTSGRLNAENGVVIKAGRISATKQWKENREGELEKSKKGGDSVVNKKKGVHSLSSDEHSKNGKKGYENGLGKLSKEKKNQIASKAGLVNRDINAKLKIEDVLFMRNNFIPRHNEFGIVAFSKKYGVSESQIRNAVKGRSFKNL
jgi:hypothetical protein